MIDCQIPIRDIIFGILKHSSIAPIFGIDFPPLFYIVAQVQIQYESIKSVLIS